MAVRTVRGVVDDSHAWAPSGFDDFYRELWWPMVRLATGLVDEVGAAEDVVQDAFTAVYRKWDTIREPRAAVGYLRTAVVNSSRSALRRRIVARKHLSAVADDHVEAADADSLRESDADVVRRTLRRLPDRQREVLTLRFLADLSDAEISAATGLTESGVRSASSRGLTALRELLGGKL
jgi:RNA polymerase sigma-70 factor (sigma-E family)